MSLEQGLKPVEGFVTSLWLSVINGSRFREDSITSTNCAPNIMHIHCKSLNSIIDDTVYRITQMFTVVLVV